MKCDQKLYLDRVHKIAGQVAALETMFADKRSAQEIVQQMIAVRASLSSLATFVVQAEIQGCLPTSESAGPVSQLVESVFKVS